MKKVNPKEPVNRGVLDEAVEAILNGVEKMFGNFCGEMNTKFSKIDERFDKLEAGQKDLQRQIGDLKYDTPTQKEFETLKGKVDKYHPLALWYLIGFSGSKRKSLKLPPTPDCV